MQTNIRASKEDMDTVEKMLDISHVKTSRLPDSKNIFKNEDKEKAIKKRYGRAVKITVTYDMEGNKLKEITLRFQSEKNKVYSLTEYFKEDQTTDYCLLCCKRNDRAFEYRFDRFLDAEVSMIDMIAEE